MSLSLSFEGASVLVSDLGYNPYDEPAVDGITTYRLDAEPAVRPTSRHRVDVQGAVHGSRACLLLAGGGTSGVHAHSAIVHDSHLLIAVGPFLCALRLPSLELAWSVRVDWATCFGVYNSEKHDCFVTHGEMEVSRITRDGQRVWSSGGKDIFSEGFTLHDDHVEVVDFNHERYRIDLATGRSVLEAPAR